MNFLKNHWFDIGIILGICCGIYLYFVHGQISTLQELMWISLITLFAHQVEEYRYPGYFPGNLNTVIFKSNQPDRYPLNSQSAFIINVILGWGSYLLAALFVDKAPWLGLATILISVGNIFFHLILCNIKGRTFYNPGVITSLFLFVPVSYLFFEIIITNNLLSSTDWIIGIILGIVLNFGGIPGFIILIKNKNTLSIFSKRFLIPKK
jgi:hypothetical protein